MNFLDTYDITSSGGSTPPPNQPQQSLNEEVNQVIGQLGRFWGGFRKQSQTVFETARKDLGDVVTQAQKELSKLATTAEETIPSTEDAEEATPMASSTATLNEADVNAAASTSPGPSYSSSSQSTWNTQTLFSRLQSALPPNVVSTVQRHIPESVRHASEHIDLTQLRTNLLSEVQRIQGVTRAQAEEYVHKSEALLREAVKEAQEVFKDAVKVIPPEETSSRIDSTSSGLIWDGSDMWTLPEDVEDASSAAVDAVAGPVKGKGKSVDAGVSAVATRAEALLRRLRHDPTIVRKDPGSDGATKDLYMGWVEREVASKEGGLEGEEWQTIIAKNLDDTADGRALASLKDALVPSEMTETEFWQRFFFRTYQIKGEEEKRKALLQVNTESEDDFDWDDEDSDEDKVVAKESTPTRSSALTIQESSDPAPPSSVASTRESSFDVVSSANASSSGEAAKQSNISAKKGEEEEDEGEDEEEEEDEDDEDDDSDWE